MRQVAFTLLLLAVAASSAHATLIQIGADASNYVLFDEGAGGHN